MSTIQPMHLLLHTLYLGHTDCLYTVICGLVSHIARRVNSVATIDIIVTATAVGNTIHSVSQLSGTEGRPVNVGKHVIPPVYSIPYKHS